MGGLSRQIREAPPTVFTPGLESESEILFASRIPASSGSCGVSRFVKPRFATVDALLSTSNGGTREPYRFYAKERRKRPESSCLLAEWPPPPTNMRDTRLAAPEYLLKLLRQTGANASAEKATLSGEFGVICLTCWHTNWIACASI